MWGFKRRENIALRFLRYKSFSDHYRLDSSLRHFQTSCYLVLGDFYMPARAQRGAF